MTSRRKPSRALTVVLLLILFGRLTFASRKLSFTSDEPSHIATGYAYLAQGATWTVPLRGHPPLLNAWLAMPFYVGAPNIPIATLPGWQEDNTTYVKAFVPFLRDGVARAEVATRTPVVLLSVLLAAVVARWAECLVGRRGRSLSLLVLMSDPTFLAHGMLATNDVGAVALGTLGLFLTYRSIQHSTATRVLFAGFALGLTMLAKGSGIIWLAGALLMIVGSLARGRRDLQHVLGLLAVGIGLSGVALLSVWLCYGLEWGPLEVGTLTIPVPAPTHWQGILTQSTGAEERWTYFLGTVRQGGSWAYFPVAGLIKNPIPLIVLGVWGLASYVRRERQRALTPIIWIFPILYLGTAIASGVNIGYRHMLPLHPFIYLLIVQLPLTKPAVKSVCAFLVVWLTAESLVTAPYYLSYFSPIVGGSEQGWRYLADSNTDWGQGYRSLRSYQVANKECAIIGYSGPEGYIGLATYDVQYTALPPVHSNPAPILLPDLYPDAGHYAISANSLSGLGSVAPDNYSWFRYHQADTVVADAIFIYDVPPMPEHTWLAQCSVPMAPLNAAAITEGFSPSPSRQVTFDCSQAWIYPAGPDQMGWYAMHEQTMLSGGRTRQRLGLAEPKAENAFVARRLAQLHISYRQWDYRETPAFLLYESTSETPASVPQPRTTYIDYVGSAPTSLSETADLPVALEGPLMLLGVQAYQNGNALEIETWWQVTSPPSSMPFSVMAHLVRGDGATVEVADGFGIALSDLAQGDIVVQSHGFTPDGSLEGLWFRTGVYWLETTQLWAAADQAGNAIFVPLQEVIVR